MKNFLLAGLLLLSAQGLALAQTAQHGVQAAVTITKAWSRAMPSARSSAVVYFTITDAGTPDKMTGAATPIADKAQLHETSMADGIMRMRPVNDLAVTSDHPVMLAPGGYHLMLTGLHRQLAAGDTFPLTLTFEHAGAIATVVSVEKAGAAGTNMGSMPGMDMGGMSH